MDIDKRIIMKHNLYEKYQEECLNILRRHKPKACVVVDKYTAPLHDYILKIATEEDLKFYTDKPRGNVISCKYISNKLDMETDCKLMVLEDIYEYKEEIKLHIIKTTTTDDIESFIKGMTKKLSSLGIGAEIIELNDLTDLLDYTEDQRHTMTPFIVLKPLSKIFTDNVESLKVMLGSLDNANYRDVDCFLDMDTSTKLNNCKLGYVPSTLASVIEIFKEFNITTKNYTHVYVLGQSPHLGKPIADVLEYNNYATYTANSRTSKHVKEAIFYSSDVTISVTGSPDICKLFNKQHVSTNYDLAKRVVIDVGIVKENGKIRGDVPNDIKSQYMLYNKVPNGVGLIDTSIVALRTIESYYTQLKLKGELR